MTTQAELLQMAERHTSDKAVRLLLMSLSEARVQAQQHLTYMESASKVLQLAVKASEGFSVSHDHSEYVQRAAKACACAQRMANDFVTLACILEHLGESVSY